MFAGQTQRKGLAVFGLDASAHLSRDTKNQLAKSAGEVARLLLRLRLLNRTLRDTQVARPWFAQVLNLRFRTMSLSRFRLITFDVHNTLLQFRSSPGKKYGEIGAMFGISNNNNQLVSNYVQSW